MPTPEFGHYPGQIMVPELPNRAQFASRMHDVIVREVMGGSQIIRANIGGVMRFFRLPCPAHIMDFVSIRDVGARHRGNVAAEVHVLIPEVATADVEPEDAEGSYFYRVFVHAFAEK